MRIRPPDCVRSEEVVTLAAKLRAKCLSGLRGYCSKPTMSRSAKP